MEHIQFDYLHSLQFVDENVLRALGPAVKLAHEKLHTKSGKGHEYLGWLDLPITYDRVEFDRIKRVAKHIQEGSDAFIVVGVGGSYLGARAAIEMLSHTFHNEQSSLQRKTPQIYYVGHNLSTTYICHLLEVLDGKEISVNVISKSGTTTEPAIAFRILKQYMEKKYGKSEACKRIYVTTDSSKGALRQLAKIYGYESFVIPNDIGGRYSILTAVGLLPIAVSGADVDLIIAGAITAYYNYAKCDIETNASYQYAAIRHALYKKGYKIELLANYEPNLRYLGEWWKQLFGESEGKDKKGIFPATVNFTTDLHSLGQYIQDGERHLFETTLWVESCQYEMTLPEDEENLDRLNYLAGKPLDMVNRCAFEGSLLAHVEGGVPNLVVKVPRFDENSFGQLVYFFEKACAISCYLLDINPFNQPGVEDYKRNMFELLRKP